MNAYRPQIGMGYHGIGSGYVGVMDPSFGPMTQQQQQVQEDKGKGRMVELDDQNWEAQFAEIDAAGQNALDEEANAAIETELNDLDRSVPNETDDFSEFESIWRGIQAETAANRRIVNEEIDFDTVHMGDFSDWDNFDGGLNTHGGFRDPQLGDYLFDCFSSESARARRQPFSRCPCL